MMGDGDRSDWTFGEWVRHSFRDRELYIRSEGVLRYVVIRTWMQVAGVAACCVVAGWIGLTTVSFFFQEQSIFHANSRVQSVRLSYEDRIAAIQDRIDEMSDKLMLDQDAYLEQVDVLRSEFAELVRRHHRLEVFFEQGWLPIGGTNTQPGTGTGSSIDAAGSTQIPQREGWWRGRNAAPFRTAEEAQRPLHEARLLFADFTEQQRDLLDRVVAQSEAESDRLRTLFRRLGLDPAQVVGAIQSVPNATGGPLLPVQLGEEPEDGIDQLILEAHRRFSEAEKLRYAVSRMPIRLPLARGYRLSSGFGFRRDPFTDLLAMHAGVDLKADHGDPVTATADGRVARSELTDAYGKVIDIEHDNGVMTRYAHLSELGVEVGDRVRAGQFIGRIGTTGRSTGPHLHYETRIDDRPIDPYQFLRVARDVLQQEEN
jgi:murein DD-endopeptidase MepM/ murein hydrolase activator NlpD